MCFWDEGTAGQSMHHSRGILAPAISFGCKCLYVRCLAPFSQLKLLLAPELRTLGSVSHTDQFCASSTTTQLMQTLKKASVYFQLWGVIFSQRKLILVQKLSGGSAAGCQSMKFKHRSGCCMNLWFILAVWEVLAGMPHFARETVNLWRGCPDSFGSCVSSAP